MLVRLARMQFDCDSAVFGIISVVCCVESLTWIMYFRVFGIGRVRLVVSLTQATRVINSVNRLMNIAVSSPPLILGQLVQLGLRHVLRVLVRQLLNIELQAD